MILPHVGFRFGFYPNAPHVLAAAAAGVVGVAVAVTTQIDVVDNKDDEERR